MNILRIAALLFVSGVAVWAQQSTATIKGLAVNAETSEALSKVTVLLYPDTSIATPPRIVTTGSNGQFAMENVPPGDYRLAATRDGYSRSEYGQQRIDTPGLLFKLTAGQTMLDVRLPMTPTGSITGKVFDRNGVPAKAVVVDASQMVYQNGRRYLAAVQRMITDDRGEYRLFWLPPGQYYLSASFPEQWGGTIDTIELRDPSRPLIPLNADAEVSRSCCRWSTSQHAEISTPMYFPGTADIERASPIDLSPGASLTGLDLTVSRIRPRHIGGVIVNDEQIPDTISVLLVPADTRLEVRGQGSTMKNSSFEFFNVLPGSYFVVARDARTEVVGIASVDVRDSDEDNVRLAVGQRTELKGRVTVDGPVDVLRDLPAQLTIGLQTNPPIPSIPTFLKQPVAQSAADGSFVIPGVIPGVYQLTVALSQTAASSFDGKSLSQRNAYIKSMSLGTEDISSGVFRIGDRTDRSFRVVIGTNVGTVDGRVLNDKREPVAGAIVGLAPDAARRARTDLYHVTSTDAHGSFQFQGVGPGQYTVLAWDRIERGEWTNPDFIRAHEDKGKPVTVEERRKTTIEVNVILTKKLTP